MSEVNLITEKIENCAAAATKASCEPPCAELLRHIQAAGYDLEADLRNQVSANHTKTDKAYLMIQKIKEIGSACDRPIVVTTEDDRLYYNGKCWELVSDKDFSYFLSLCASAMKVKAADSICYKFIKEVMDNFGVSEYYRIPAPKFGVTLLNCNNGTVEITQQGTIFREHRKEDGLRYVLSYDYDASAKAPRFLKFLNEMVPQIENQMNMQEFCGWVFAPYINLEKCLLLYGSSGNNGKTTFKDIICEVIGKRNISTSSLSALCSSGSTGETSRYGLQGKLLNSCGETKKIQPESDIFKMLASGEPFSVRLPYEKETREITNYAKLLFCCNNLPKFENGAGRAEARRFIFINFNNEVVEEKKDTQLKDTICSNELPGVLNWCIEGLRRLIANNNKLSKNPHSDAVKEQFRRNSDSVYDYIQEYQIRVNDHSEAAKLSGLTSIVVTMPELFGSKYHAVDDSKSLHKMTSYRKWCDDNGRNAVGKAEFTQRLKDHKIESKKTNKGNTFDLLVDMPE